LAIGGKSESEETMCTVQCRMRSKAAVVERETGDKGGDGDGSDTVTRQWQRRNGNSQGDTGDDYDNSGIHGATKRQRSAARQPPRDREVAVLAMVTSPNRTRRCLQRRMRSKAAGASANREAAKVAMAKGYGERSDGHSERWRW
jgi:hypothetical protein